MAKRFYPPHDNALCHTSLLVWQFLSTKNNTVCPHPPYSPDLAPCDFWLFPKVKMTIKGKRLESIQDIEAATTAQLKDTHGRGLPELLQKVARTMGCVRSGGRGSILRGISGNVSFTVIILLFTYSPYFLITPRTRSD